MLNAFPVYGSHWHSCPASGSLCLFICDLPPQSYVFGAPWRSHAHREEATGVRTSRPSQIPLVGAGIFTKARVLIRPTVERNPVHGVWHCRRRQSAMHLQSLTDDARRVIARSDIRSLPRIPSQEPLRAAPDFGEEQHKGSSQTYLFGFRHWP
jgi:hypothetical protein